jgi:hypothetical protein
MAAPQYNTGLLIGRAFAHAHRDPSSADSDDAAEELYRLAAGDRLAIQLAQARFREFLAGPTPSPEDARALSLLNAAMQRFDSPCTA